MDLRYLSKVFGDDLQRISPRKDVTNTQLQEAYHSNRGIIYNLHFFPSAEGLRRLESKRLELPNFCCVCEGLPVKYLPLRPLSWFHRLFQRWGVEETPLFPHCESHSNNHYAIFCGYFASPRPDSVFYCFGLSREFLRAIRRHYGTGEFVPPWVFAPQLSIYASWNLGTLEETWIATCWRPFWTQLTEAERVEYLDRWEAPTVWRDSFLCKDGIWNWRSNTKKFFS
jgi:hypothetical protein